MGKRHPPSTLCTRQLPRTRKIGCLSRPAMRPQQPTSCTPSFSQFRVIVTLIPVMLSTAPVCVHGVVRSSCKAHCPGSMPCHDRGDVRHASGWGCVCNETFGGPICNVRSCHHCPLHSLYLEKAQTSTLSGCASVRARGREPDVTGRPSAPLEPSPLMIRLRHHLSRTTGVLAQRQHRGTVDSRLEFRPSVLTLIEVFRKRHRANFPLAGHRSAFSHNIYR